MSANVLTARRRLPFALSEDEQSKVTRLAKIRIAAVRNANVAVPMEAFQQMLVDIAATCELQDGTPPPASVEGYAIVITAPSGCGKSHVLDKIADDPRVAVQMGDYGTVRPLVRVSAPSPCTLKTLGAEILTALGWEGTLPRLEHQIWHAVRKQMIAQQVLILMIDEAHRVLKERTSGEKDKVAETLNNLMVGTYLVAAPPSARTAERHLVEDRGVKYPVFLILAGVPELEDFTKDRDTQSREQFSRRCREIPFKKMDINRDDKTGQAVFRGLDKFIPIGLREMGFEPEERLITPDMLRRFHKASAEYLGRVMLILKTAASLAVHAGSDKVEPFLAHAFEAIYDTGEAKNCFLVPDIAKCLAPPHPLTDEEKAERAKCLAQARQKATNG